MPPTTTKTLSPAELAKLEHAFATDPASEAYRPLAEAYLGMGRFMEAMVVCKKGVKAHPSKPDPRVLLARVYAEQGKDKKALEELAGAIGIAPNDKLVLRMTGALQLKTGEADAGKTNLLKAWEIDPADEDTKAIFSQYKVELPKPAAPPPPPAPVAPPPTNGSSNAAQQPVNGQVGQSAPKLQPVQGRPSAPRPAGQPAQAGRPAAAPRRSYEETPSEQNEISELSNVPARRRRKANTGAAVTIALFVLVIVGLSAYYGIGQYKAKRAREVKRLLLAATDALKGDSYDSYQKASKTAEEALNMDSESAQAHAFAAYAYAIRWGEHGGDETVRKSAEEHIAEANRFKGKEPISQLLAAEALMGFYSGKGGPAAKNLGVTVAELEARGARPSLLYLTLGLIQMNQGDLDGAKENLEKAQQAASDDPRVYAALGTLARRRGNDGDALKSFSTALKYTRNSHPEALVGTALLILDQENPAGGYISASKYLKTLLESEPPPSPRQLAMAHMVRAFLVSRVAHDIKLYDNKDFQKQLADGTGVDGDAAKAKSEITKEEDLAMQDKNNPELFLVKGKRLVYEDNVPGAATEIRKAIAINAERAHFHVELAKALMRKEGSEKEAEEAIKKAIGLVGETPKLMTLLGQILYKQKKVDEALAQYEKAVKDPKTKNGEARFALGMIYRNDKKDLMKSYENFDRAAGDFVGDTLMTASSYDEAGISIEQKGDKVKAKEAYEKSLNAEPQYDKIYCDYARFLTKTDPAAEKAKIKGAAEAYLKLSPKGECAAEMTRLNQ